MIPIHLLRLLGKQQAGCSSNSARSGEPSSKSCCAPTNCWLVCTCTPAQSQVERRAVIVLFCPADLQISTSLRWNCCVMVEPPGNCYCVSSPSSPLAGDACRLAGHDQRRKRVEVITWRLLGSPISISQGSSTDYEGIIRSAKRPPTLADSSRAQLSLAAVKNYYKLQRCKAFASCRSHGQAKQTNTLGCPCTRLLTCMCSFNTLEACKLAAKLARQQASLTCGHN